MVSLKMTREDLEKWRKDHGLTQEALGKKLGVTRVCISRWESGKRKVPAFLQLALNCLKVKKGGESKKKRATKMKKERKVKK